MLDPTWMLNLTHFSEEHVYCDLCERCKIALLSFLKDGPKP